MVHFNTGEFTMQSIRKFKPIVEVLEDRQAPAVTIDMTTAGNFEITDTTVTPNHT